MDSNKVSVKIYGQEYTITGEKPREQIVKIAAYVDNKMHEISEIVTPGPESSLAVLSSVNICDEYFDLLDEIEELKNQNMQLHQDVQHYVQLWEEAKKTNIQQKEEARTVMQQKDDLQQQLVGKERELRNMRDLVKAAEAEAVLKAEAPIKELENKCKELENSFFDIQMENIQLKKEVGNYKRNNEERDDDNF